MDRKGRCASSNCAALHRGCVLYIFIYLVLEPCALYICAPCLLYVNIYEDAGVLHSAAPGQENLRLLYYNGNASKRRMQCIMVWLQQVAIKTRLN